MYYKKNRSFSMLNLIIVLQYKCVNDDLKNQKMG